MKRAVLIGGSRAQKLPALVCEYSIRSWGSPDVEILHGWDTEPPEPRDPSFRSKTGFSFQRFTLPLRAGYAGLGVYLDSDMILLDSIVPLFDAVSVSVPGLMTTRNLPAVIGVDCARHHWSAHNILETLDQRKVSYRDLLDLRTFDVERTLPDSWNELDAVRDDTKLVHYTDMSRQCWRVRDKRPVSKVWMDTLKCAISDGFIKKETVAEEVKLGHVGEWIL